jgi:hypothetical protein
MTLRVFGKFCCLLVHACAAACAAYSFYLFLIASIDYILIAIVLLSAAIGLEVIAAVISSEDPVT